MHSNQLKLYFSLFSEFSHVDEISNGNVFRITQVIHNDIQKKYVKKSITFGFNVKIRDKFIHICEELISFQNCLPFILPISFIIKPRENNYPELIYPYYEKGSLRDIIIKRSKNENIQYFDESQKIIFIYCLSLLLERLHSKHKFHGNLKASNIIIDDNNYPLVSDLFLYKLNNNDKKEESFYQKFDVYSFGIIVLQIYQPKINIFLNKEYDSLELKEENVDFDFTNNIKIVPESIRSLILECLSNEQDERPNATKIRSTIENILKKPQYKKEYTKLHQYIQSKFESNDKKELKKYIQENNIEKLFKYAVRIKDTNEDESLLYFHYGAIHKHEPSRKHYEEICKKNQAQLVKSEDPEKKSKTKFINLIDDPFFDETKIDMNAIVNDVNQHYNDEETIKFDSKILQQKGFILTKGAKKRLTQIHRYLLEGVPVLLEGPTGTSKTISAQIVCELLDLKLIKYNLSSETKTGDLLGRYVGDSNSWSGIKMHEGPFIDAFKSRKDEQGNELSCVLLLDEINLANQECLHFIEETLDSDEISTEIPGMPLKRITKGPGFRLIATQNPNKGLFVHKRQDLGLKFLSRFQVINFPKLDDDELKSIASGLSKCEEFRYKKDKKLINDLVEFHVEWSELPEIRDEVQCFTVREIEATIHALCGPDALNPYDAVMTIYGARYQKEKKSLLIQTLLKFESFRKYQLKSIEDNHNNYVFNGVGFPFCYQNKNLAEALKSVFISFKMNRHVILAGEEGCGLTKIARLIAKCHSMQLKDAYTDDKEYFCICTEETKCSDLIGGQKATDPNKESNSLIKWKRGFLTKAIRSGYCAVLDSIDEATSTITERINPLLDQKFNSNEMKFEIPENPNEPEILINPNFRLLCTCKIDKINQMSPAFINRFDVIVLENQLEDIEENELKDLILMLMKENFIIKSSKKNEKKIEEEDENDDIFDSSFYYSDDEVKIEEKELEISDEIIELVYQKFDIKKMPTFQNLSQFCKAVATYLLFFEKEKSITPKEIVDFSYKMLQKNVDFEENEIPKSMVDFLLKNLKNKDIPNSGQFIYKESNVLKTFIAKLYAASIINLPVCIYGPTGVGKTSAAEQFSLERSTKGYLKHSFHAGTKPNHFYATTTIQDRKIKLKYGSLTTAMIEGRVFIADEMNLSSLSNMKSLAPALEPCIGKKVFIPGIGETITIDSDFFFIACQNELGTLGRNAIPSSIASRFRYFDYPELNDEEIANLCFLKRLALYDKNNKEISTDSFINDSKNLGRFMIALNNLKERVIPKWSFRDITKIFLRVHQQYTFANRYKNISFYHQVLFFTISVLNEEDSKKMLDQICNLIQEKFKLSIDQRNSLFDCYIADPIIDGNFIMKGKSGVFSSLKECDLNSPAPLLNALFITKLSHENEPIIYMGPSSYKTYLAKKILNNAKVITLNHESTNAQLLGKSYPFTKTESKLFYLDTLMLILNVKYDDKNQLKEKLEKNNLELNEFLNKVCSSVPELKQDESINDEYLETIFNKYLNRVLPESFKYAFVNLIKKLFTNSEIDDNSIISNFVFEFKPGLFLSSILEGKSLILKNLSNLQTIVFERFNELFSGDHSLTLQEDINNTFTKDDINRKLTKFNSDFRVFGTCPPNSLTKLSEAVLSRFTVIYTHQYSQKDQKKVLYLLDNLKSDKSFIDYAINLSEQINNDRLIKKSITFIQMINIIEMHSKLIANQNMIDQKDLLSTVLYRVILGILEKRDKNKGNLRERINNIFKEIGMTLRNELISPLSENSLHITIENGIKMVKSKITNITIESPAAHEIKNSNITFTKMFVEMIETIHLGLASHTPIILEGTPGQGKQTAIKYLADILGYNIINIMISQTTKANDLLGKLNISYDDNHNIRVEIIKTKLIEAIESEDKASSSIIVFHNINHASSAVLEVIQTIFDPHETNICLSNGSLIPKGNLNLIGIYNTQNGYSTHSNLPSSLINSSIYYIVNNPTKEELENIIQQLFTNTKFKDDWVSFYSSFYFTNKIAKDNNYSSILTLNDVVKYIIFREATFNKIDRDIIAQMIFAYRFINEETIKEVKKKINVKDMNFCPSFTYDTKNTFLNINVKNEESKKFSKGININLYSNQIDNHEIESCISCLTLPQRHCLLFLACSVLSKRSCILQGSTSSGKSHIIRLFAKMLGQDLIVYQMNKDMGISILTGQPLLSSTLNDKDTVNIKLWLSNISLVSKFKDYINDNFSNDPKEWKLTYFNEFLGFIEKNKEIIPDEHKEFIKESVINIKKIIRHEKRFTHQESEFIKAMKEGKWILIDGIESAPPEIAQKISSLCGDNPELHLIESGKNNYFSRNKNIENAQLIHDNFHLFVTFNPTSQKENVSLDPSFFNKCVSFSLPPIDSSPEYSAQILHGSLLKMSYPNDVAIEIGARMSMSHKVAKNESMNNNDVFAGDLQFTGRTLKFITTEFQLHAKNGDISKNIYIPVCNSFHSFYWNSELKNNNEGNLKKNMIDAFSKSADNDIVTGLNQKSDNPKVRNIDVLMILRSIQAFAFKKNNKSDFSYEFIQKCRKTKLSDLPFIIKHIQETINIINDKSNYLDNIFQFEYHQLSIILNILNEINVLIPSVSNDLKDAKLDNHDLLTVNNQLTYQLLKLQLLELLQNDNFSYINSCTPNIFYVPELFNLLQIVIEMSQYEKIEYFIQFISLISNKQELIPMIEEIFPYNLFIDTKYETMNYWMPMFLSLYNKRITFHVKINDSQYNFINDQSLFEPTYIFSQNNIHNTLLLCPGTKLKIHEKNKKKHSHKESQTNSKELKYEDCLKRNYHYYGLTQYILLNNITDRSKLKETKNNYLKKIPYPKEEQKSSFNLLIPKNSPKRSMVSNIWSLIFSMKEDQIEIMNKYLHPLEVEVSRSLLYFLHYLSINNINGIYALTKWMNNYKNDSFGDENSYLWRIYDNSLQFNTKMNETKIEEEITLIKNEINYLSLINSRIEGFSTDEFINLIKGKVLSYYQNKLQEINLSTKEKMIKNQLIQLLIKVKDTEPIKQAHKDFKDSFINEIQKIIDNNASEELLNECQKNYDEFIKLISKNDIKSSSLIWPCIRNERLIEEKDFTNTIKLYKHILWYSQASSIIEKIINKKILNVHDISDLCEVSDMKGITSYLINKIINKNENDRKIVQQDINVLRSTLKAQFICKLIEDKLFEQIINLDQILNNLENRLSTITEMNWINQYASKYPADLQIVLPYFIPNDIFYLFVCYENGANVSCGPYLKINKIADQEIADSLKQYLNKKITKDRTKFTRFSLNICTEIYRIKINNSPNVPDNIEDFKLLITSNLEEFKSDKSKEHILKNIQNILSITEQLKICNIFNFTFNDTLFLTKKDWMNETEFVNKYPSLLYWLSLNEYFYKEQLQRKFENYKFTNDKLPFWLFATRIMSSLKCVEFHSQNHSEIALLIKRTINRTISNVFEKPSKICKLGTKWVNFLLQKVPSEIFNNNYKMLYQFFINLSQDIPTNIKFIDDNKLDFIESFSEKITNLVFDNEVDELFDMPFYQNDDTLKFFINPQNQFVQKINEYLNNEFNSFNNENLKQLKICSNNIKDKIDDFIKNLKILVQKENETIENNYIQTRNNKYEKIKSEVINDINQYNSLFFELMSDNLNMYDFLDRIYDLYDIKQEPYMKRLKEDKTKTLQINIIYYDCSKFGKNQHMQLVFQNKKNRPYTFKNNQYELYFREKDYSFNDLQNSELQALRKKKPPFRNIPKNVYNEFYYPYVYEENAVENICKSEISKPYLVFGGQPYFEDYIKELAEKINILTASIDEIDNEIMNSNINFESISKMAKIKETVEFLIPFLNVKYSENNYQQKSLNDIINHLKQLETTLKHTKSYASKLDEFINNIMKQNYSEIINIKSSFLYNYSIPFPSTENKVISKSIFSSLKNCDFLSSPFLCLGDDDSITCCFKELECTIGPFIPSLYSGRVTVNFISFIDNPITIEIKTKDKEYQSWFYSTTFKAKDIAKIYISLSNSKLEKDEKFDIEADILISSPGKESLLLPAIFHIVLVPQIIYLSCDKYPLSLNKNNNFILCAEKLISNDEIKFLMHNHNLNELLDYRIQFESLEGNESPKPKYNRTEENLNIFIQNVKKPARIHCAIHLKFSEELQASIIIDSIILPFDFSFSLYDYTKKNYVSDSSLIMYSNQFINRSIILHCKISSPIFELLKDKSISFKGSFESKLQQEIQITKNEIKETFEIDKETDFDIYITVNNCILYNNKIENYISVNINNIVKKIKLVFKFPENPVDGKYKPHQHNINKYDFYRGFKSEIGNWIIIDSKTDLENISAIVSPFNYKQIKQVKLNYSDSECSIINSEENLFIYLSTNGEISFKNEVKTHIPNLVQRTISDFNIPLFGICQNEWYPYFNKYSKKLKDFENLEITKENNEKVKKLIKPSFFNMKLNFDKFASYLFENDKMILTLKTIINSSQLTCFKENLDNADKILSYIDQYEIDEELRSILSCNIIKLLNESFEKRFFDLKSQNFTLKPILSDEQLKSKSDELYEEYCSIGNDTKKQYNFQLTRGIEKLIESVSKIKCNELPPLNERNDAYLIGFNTTPVAKDIKPKFINISTNVFNSLSKNINVQLPEISLPNQSDLDELSILKINDLYQVCLKGTRILPIFIKNVATEKTDYKINQALEFLVLLYRAFTNCQNPDKSIISQSVDEFRESFCSMIGKFTRAGMDFSNIIQKRFIRNNEINQDFISYPRKTEFYLHQDIWNDKLIQSNNKNNFLFQQTISDTDKIHVGEIQSYEEEQKISNETKITPEKESQIISSNTQSIKTEKVQVSIIKSFNFNDDDDDDLSDDDSEYENNNDENINKPDIVLVTSDKKSVKISDESFDGLMSKFNKKDSIKASIARMKGINEMSTLVIDQCQPPNINPQFFKPPTTENKLTIQSLIELSLPISHQLITVISNQEVPFSDFSVNILVDCSTFISLENKMFNMFLICALTTALYVLSIPYSVAVFGDSNFKCIIKQFDENHSSFALQKVLDCIFIKRFCSNLPTAVKFAIDDMKHDKRKHRAIFTFTSGLDDQIRLTKSWSELIFNDKNLSFQFIFIKSQVLDQKDEEFLQKVWKKFETDTKIFKALSNVKVTSINPSLSSIQSFSEGFQSVMKRIDEIENVENAFVKPVFDLISNKSPVNIKYFSQLIDEKRRKLFSENNDVYVETTDVLKNLISKIDRLDTSLYNHNKLNQIIKSHSKDKKSNEFNSFIKKFIDPKSKINQSSLETIFRPNKGSQNILSDTGSDIDITALILNMINPVPDPLIYLEEKGGLIRNYGVSIIIDPSISCLFDISFIHTILTIKTILSSFAALDLPCFDLIVASDSQPTVLCHEIGTFHSLDFKSNLWENLFILLQNGAMKSDLASAIKAAYDLKRTRSKDYTSFLFVITDGLYERSQKNRILQVVNNCVQSGISVFGIGVGMHPKGICELFPQVVFSPNPSLVMKCVASLFGDSISGRKEKMPTITKSFDSDKIKETFNKLINNENDPIYRSLKEELSKIKHLQDAFRHYLNSEGDIGNAQKGFTNVEGENSEMYPKGIFQSQKILIVMLWDYGMNPSHESDALQDKYIYKNKNPNKRECIKTALDHFGITFDVVKNYKSAIEKLLRQEKTGFSYYYAVWIICGPPMDKLPDNSPYPNLVGQFIEVITQFWENGGALVFWADGDPLYYQVNLFLKKNKFNFEIQGKHQGGQFLFPDESNELSKIKTFNRHPQGNEINFRSSLAHNLGRIYEGFTISYAEYNLNKIKPFIPFSRDSEGGISSMFLPSDKDKGTGDIVIDCGYTKCFDNITEDGTYRYIQNIAGWTMNNEGHTTAGWNPEEWRPKAIDFTIDLGAIWHFPITNNNPIVDIIFIIDATGSMSNWLSAAKRKAKEIAVKSKEKYPNISFNFGAIFYKDPIASKRRNNRDKNVGFNPTDDIDELVRFMSNQVAEGGGGDGPEDWAGAYHILLNQMIFRQGATRAVIHIADAPAHGSEWGGNTGFLFSNEGSRLEGLIIECAQSNIFFSGINIIRYGKRDTYKAIDSFNKVEQIYKSEGKKQFFRLYSINDDSSDYAADMLQEVTYSLISVIAAF